MIEQDTTFLGADRDIATHAMLDAAAVVRARVHMVQRRTARGPYDPAELAADLKLVTDSLERVVTEAHRFVEHDRGIDLEVE